MDAKNEFRNFRFSSHLDMSGSLFSIHIYYSLILRISWNPGTAGIILYDLRFLKLQNKPLSTIKLILHQWWIWFSLSVKLSYTSRTNSLFLLVQNRGPPLSPLQNRAFWPLEQKWPFLLRRHLPSLIHSADGEFGYSGLFQAQINYFCFHFGMIET